MKKDMQKAGEKHLRLAENPDVSSSASSVRFCPSDDEKQLSLAEVGQWLGIDARTVKRKLIDKGLLPCVEVTPRNLRVSVGAVREYLAKQDSKNGRRALAEYRKKKG